VNDAVVPAVAVVFDGWTVTEGATGAGVTVSVAADVVAVPPELENTASYSYPFSLDDEVKEYVVDRAPEMFVNVVPFVETLH
jgi:hypothetical protein